MNIILASKSPRRKELLHKIIPNFKVVEANIDENYNSFLKIVKIPEVIALNKALTVQEKYKNDLIIAADTIVEINHKILGKPKNQQEAYEMLKTLSNQTHQVITGVCILFKNKKIVFHATTKVTFYELSETQISNYIETKFPFDKAGGYGIQDSGALFVKKINGCYYNVMGLPIALLNKKLSKIL